MMNQFILKKYGALLLVGFMSVIAYSIGATFYNFIVGIGAFGVALLVSVIASNLLLKNPFTDMLEGKGLLVFDLNSTGVINLFILSLKNPFVTGNYLGEKVNDIFNRKAVLQLSTPIKTGEAVLKENENKEKYLDLNINLDDFNTARFGLYQYPVLVYNSQIKSLVTKDFLSNQEKTAFAEHGVLYLNRKLEELTSVVRDFGRHVVESLKPQGNLLANKWVISGIVISLIIMLVLFGKPLYQTIMGVGTSAGGSVLGSSGAVIPR